jgi:DNA invertase Pin-like site-specific DNA recombinase
MASPGTTRTIIYTRISKDRAGDEHGVANQLADCERYAAGRDWQVVRRISDNDLSASNGKHRPGFDAVMAAVDAGQVDIVLTWAVDRFVRRIADLESVIGRFQAAGVKLAAVTGDLDLSNDAGRTVARMLSVIAQGEVERKGARQRLAAAEAARGGKRPGSPHRPFGYQPGGLEADPVEADAIRWAADCLLGLGTISAVMREWNARGLVTAQGGRPFTRQSVTAILRNPRIANLATLPRGEGERHGEIVGPGKWEPILPETTWRAVEALLDDPGRKPPKGVRTLLGGLAVCRCGNPVTSGPNRLGTRVYRCTPAIRDGRPGPHVAVRAAEVDAEVEARIVAYLSQPSLAGVVDPPSRIDTAALHRKAESIRLSLDEMAADKIAGKVSRSQLIAATERGNTEIAAINAELAEAAGGGPLAPFAGAEGRAAAVWESLDRSRRRAVIRATTDQITLHPAGRGARALDLDRIVDVKWAR